MAACIQTTDWSRHALGPRETWPAALHTALGIILGSPCPMWLGWGHDLFFFCNDAFRALLGDSQRLVPGVPAREIWGGRWGGLGQVAEAVLATGAATTGADLPLPPGRPGAALPLARTMMCCSPVPGAGNEVGGVLGIVSGGANSPRAQGAPLEDPGLQDAEESMRQTQEQLRLATHLGRLGVWEWDVASNRATWSASLLEILGLPEESLVGDIDMLAALVLAEDRDRVVGAVRATLAGGPGAVEFRIRRPDGSVAWLVSQATVVKRDGQPVRLLGVTMDVSERRRARDAMGDSEERFSRFMKHLPGHAWIKDERGRYIFANGSAARALGFSSGELLGKSDAEIFPPATAEQLQRNDQLALLSEGGTQVIETLPHGEGGREAHALVVKFPMPGPPGGPASVGGMAIDITERLRAEQALREAHDQLEKRVRERTGELEEANARFRAVFDQGLFAGLIGLDGRLIEVNRSWLDATGFAREQVLGRRFWELGWWDRSPEVQAWIKIGFAEAVQGRRFHGETVCYTADGGERRIDFALMPIRNRGGDLIFVVPTGLDISDRRRVEEEMRRAELARESDARFRRMADAAPVLIWMADENNAGTWFNQQWLDFVGRPLERELGQGWLDGMHADDRPRWVQLAGEAGASRREIEMEFRLRRHDGEFRWMLNHGVPTVGPDGRLTGYIGSCIDISGRRQAELAIERLAAIVESTSDAIVSVDLEGFVTSWNRGAEGLYGYKAVEIIGQPFSVLIPRELQAEESEFLQRIRQGERVDNLETRRICRDGKEVHVSLSISPIRTTAGEITGASKIARDVSERRRTEARLKENEEALRRQSQRLAILNRVGSTLAAELELDKVVRVVIEAGHEVCGAAFSAFFGAATRRDGEGCEVLASAGAQVNAFDAFRVSRDRPVFGDSSRNPGVVRLGDWPAASPASQEQEAWPPRARSYLSVPVISRSGAVRGGLFFGHPEPDVFTAEVEQLIVAIAAQAAIAIDNAQLYRDVQHELNEHLRAEHALRESEERFRTLADNIAQFAWMADETGAVLWFNQRWFDYTGTIPADTLGEGWRSVLHPGHIERVLENYRRSFQLGTVLEDTFPLRKRDGSYRWFLTRAVPIRDRRGDVVRWFGTNTDITELREVEQALERARDEAVAASRAKDDFLAALSHELRTPLNPVLLIASDAAEDTSLPPGARADFATIRKHVSLEARLIDDLLDLTRISRGKLSLDFAEHDVHAILRDALATVAGEVGEKQVALAVQFDADAPRVRADAVRLQQVFWNVLKNAVKFTPKDGRVSLLTRNLPPGSVEIVISDTGIGISESELSRIFNAFSQGDHAGGPDTHRFGGLGLGLAISRMVVELHGGTITAASPGLGLGATFVIRLPLLRADQPADAPSAQTTGTRQEESRVGGRILLVEDHAPTRMALERLLVRRKFVVTPAGTLGEARVLARNGVFDLLISDIGLPDGSGFDLMRECAATTGLPGIALTGYGMDQDVARSREAGFFAHLIKPISVQSLDRALAEVLPRRSAPAEASPAGHRR